MKITKFDNKEDWLRARMGRITGSRLKDIVVKRGTGEKIGYYELIAERIATTPENEDAMERGIRLEEEAVQKFTEKTGIKVDTSLVIWERNDNSGIAISPDGTIGDTEAVEVKCLSSARHIEAYLTNKIPSDYEYQVLQYFIVNDKLENLYFVMYDPRMPENLQLNCITVTRDDRQAEISEYLEYQNKKLKEIEDIITRLTF